MEPCYKTFVSVGNAKQHFTRLLNVVHEQWEHLPKPILIQRGHTPFESTTCDLIDFVNMDEFIKYVNHAEVLLLHAGAGSILHSLKSGKCPIVMPRLAQFNEHVNDHQLDFAQVLHQDGKAIMIQQGSELKEALSLYKHKSSQMKVAKTDDMHLSSASHIIQKKLTELLKD